MTKVDELKVLYEDVLGSRYLRNSAALTGLFKYLWEKREEFSQSLNIWEECIYESSRSVNKDEAKEAYDYEGSVRERCMRLRKALQDYSAHSGQPWQIHLPKGTPSLGYQLSLTPAESAEGSTFSFWRGHLKSQRDVCVVYIEQLFYQSWRKRYAFRYYDCNEEHPGAALAELKQRHPEDYTDELNVAYPYVASGEIVARDLIRDWFDKHAMVDVKSAVTRRRNDQDIWNDSLIILGAGPANKMVTEVLKSYSGLDISLVENWSQVEGKTLGRIVVKNPSEEEIGRFARFNPSHTESEYTVHFSPEQGTVFALVTRIPNPHSDSVITILNTDFGRAVDQIAALLTDEERMSGKEWPKLGTPMPSCFQVLYAIPVRSLSIDYLVAKELELLAWRTYP